MNASHDPCDNFYQYACGNFKVDDEMLGDKSYYGYNNILSAEVKRVLVEELAEPGPSNETGPLGYIRQLYQRCSDQGESVDKMMH